MRTKNANGISRRTLLGAVAAGTLVASVNRGASESLSRVQVPLKIGHRASNMGMLGDFDIFRVARQIPGLMGIELQVAHGSPNLRDLDTVRRYKKEADRWGIHLPSVAGVFDRGVSIGSPGARANLEQSIRAGELLGVRSILIAFFQKDCPDMSQESSYGPIVRLLSDAARMATEAGIVLAIETSMSLDDQRKLVDLVDHPNLRVYYDIYNMIVYDHAKEAIPGIKLLGKSRIAQVHVKNKNDLIEEQAGLDWKAAFAALSEIEYDGWFVFETNHANRARMLEATNKNIEFMKKYCRMPFV